MNLDNNIPDAATFFENAAASQKQRSGKSSPRQTSRSRELFVVFLLAAFFTSVLFMLSNLFCKQELQTINSRFEARPWLVWSRESLSRLNPLVLWNYHQKHEIPCDLRHWDYTLSWLIENNHPPVVNRFVLFNHKVEDEPPEEAIKEHEWMKPLRQVPVARATLAGVIDFLASAGARLIILDRDFPQYSADDACLADAIHRAASASPPVGVLMARTVSHSASGNLIGAVIPTKPSGVLEALARLEPGRDVFDRYTGTVGVLPDQDQVVRRISLRDPETRDESIVYKALKQLGDRSLSSCPPDIDIDFSVPPESELYPVRPFSYLLDPAIKKSLLDWQPGNKDVRIKGAIVFLGDSITDVLETPLTNHDLNSRSGAETLVHAMETVSRGRWLQRLTAWNCFGADFPALDLLYALLVSAAGALVWVLWKAAPGKSLPAPALSKIKIKGLVLDLVALLVLLSANYLIACCLFCYAYIIVPVFVPSVSLSLGAIAAAFWEREREKEEKYLANLKASEDRLRLVAEKYEADLAREKAEAKAREIASDQLMRKEFVRRLNHDLNTPVGVLNWTLYEFSETEDLSPELREKVDRLIRNSEKLQELIDLIAQSYEYAVKPEAISGDGESTDSRTTGSGTDGGYTDDSKTDNNPVSLSSVLSNCLDLQKPLAASLQSDLSWSLPEAAMRINASALDLSRIFDNLVRNALKHNPAGTKVKVIGDTRNGCHQIKVIDNGRGIAARDLEHIFEAGYRVSPSDKKGQGLGLDIVSTLVAKMGGKISVTSKESQGSEFVVTLPAAEPPETVHDKEQGSKA